MFRFHAQVSTYASVKGFILDMDALGVVRDLVLPIFDQGDVVLDGKRVSMRHLERCKIVVTEELVQPRIKAWYESCHVKLADPQAQFADGTKFFDLEVDVSNALFQEFKRSVALEKVRELLEQQQRIREDLARRPEVEAVAAKKELSDTSTRIAIIIGAFVGAATGGWMNTQA